MGIIIRDRRRPPNGKSAITLALIFLVARFVVTGLADDSTPPSAKPPAAKRSNALPPKIMTTDGKVYQGIKLSRIEPDGLLVEYQPDAGGIGIAKLKFATLPVALQKQFGYDPVKASAFEQRQTQATAALSQELRQDDQARMAVLDEMSERPNLTGAVSVNTSDPTVSYDYYVPGQKPVEVGEYTAITQPRFSCHADFTFQAQQDGPGQSIRLSVATVTISLALSCHIIEPAHPYEFVSRHEEGHRKISEYFYQFGPQLAKHLGDSVIGREFSVNLSDVDTAKAQALGQAKSLVESEYMTRLYRPAMEANRYYDQLNDPEGSHLDVDQAVQQAIAKYDHQIDLQSPIPTGPPRSFQPIPQAIQ